MRNALVVIVIGALALTPTVGFAQAAKSTAKAAHNAKPASHSTSGVVKSITDTTMVVTRPDTRGGEIAFALNASTHRDGAIDVGAPVSIRYRDDAGAHVATAITAQHGKTQPAKTAKPTR